MYSPQPQSHIERIEELGARGYRGYAALSQFPLGWEMGEFRNTRDTPTRARGQIGSRHQGTDINHLKSIFR